MTERRAREAFEAQLTDRVRSWTDAAAARRIDALAVSRLAMSSRRVTGRSSDRLDAGWLGRWIAGGRWAAAALAIVVVGVIAINVTKPSPDSGINQQPTPVTSSMPSPAVSAVGPIPDVLLHSWERPFQVAPGPDLYGTGYLSLAGERLESSGLDGPTSRSSVADAGLGTLVVTATGDTTGCTTGEVGTYRWLVEGNDTVLTLTAINADACAAREKALAGPWVRADLPPREDDTRTLTPGTYQTSFFDPFGDRAPSSQLSYTVPAGWKVKEDLPATLVLHHLPDASQSQPSGDLFISLFAQPRMAADFGKGATCEPTGDAPGIGQRVDELAAAITRRPGVVSTPPVGVTIGGYAGQLLDLHLATDWTGGCRGPEGSVVGMPILQVAASDAGPGPAAAIARDQPLRLILLDLGNERTIAIGIFVLGPVGSVPFEDKVAPAMPIIESVELHPATP
ncbi:MAG: hypothetical protein ABJC39_05605 [Chloroflexota bacterium]